MSLRALLVISVLVLFSVPGLCQNGEVKGKVTQEGNQPLAGSNILIVETSTGGSTGQMGNYSITVPSGRLLSIIFSHIGYVPDTLIVNLKSGEIFLLNVQLQEQIELLPQVDIMGERNLNPSTIVLRPNSVDLVPAAFGDFSNAIRLLPGVVANNELSSAYSVRGGNFDENLVYVNWIQVYRPFLTKVGQQEGLSFVNTDLTQNAEFSSGGWKPIYGDKLSSVLNVTYRTPQRFAGNATLGLLGGSVHIEGTGGDKMTYLIGIRNKRSEYLLNTFEVDGEYLPNFTDFQGYLSFDLGKSVPARTTLGILGAYARNRYKIIPTTRASEFGAFNQSLRYLVAFEGQERLDYDTYQLGLNLNHQLTEKVNLQIIASGARTFEREFGDVEGGYRLCDVDRNPNSASFNECVTIRGIGTNYYNARNTLDGQIFNMEVRSLIDLGPLQQLRAGLEFSRNQFEDYLQEYRFTDSVGFVRIQESILSDTTTSANTFGGYIQHELSIGRGGDLSYGFRASYRDLNRQWLFSPRIQYSFQPTWQRDIIFKAVLGLYQQQPLYREMRDYDGNLNTAIKAQQSLHAILGFDRNLKMWLRPFKWTVEVYYKYLWDVIPYDIDNVRIRYLGQNSASAFAMGLDARISGEFIPGTESWFSLGLLSTHEDVAEDNQGYIRRPSDQHVTASIFFEDHLPANPTLRVNLGLVYGSGLPFGPPRSLDQRTAFNGEPYNRVDIGFSKLFLFNPQQFIDHLRLGVEILNLFGVQNTISYTWIQDISANYVAVPNKLSARFVNIKLSIRFEKKG